MSARELTTETFDTYVDAAGMPVLVDFWAPWCGPCRLLAPVLDQVADELSGRLAVSKVNVDENPGLAERFSVSAMPTLALIVDGELRHTIHGAKPRTQLLAEIAPYLDGGPGEGSPE